MISFSDFNLNRFFKIACRCLFRYKTYGSTCKDITIITGSYGSFVETYPALTLHIHVSVHSN